MESNGVHSLTRIAAEHLTDKFKASALIIDYCQIFKLLDPWIHRNSIRVNLLIWTSKAYWPVYFIFVRYMEIPLARRRKWKLACVWHRTDAIVEVDTGAISLPLRDIPHHICVLTDIS